MFIIAGVAKDKEVGEGEQLFAGRKIEFVRSTVVLRSRLFCFLSAILTARCKTGLSQCPKGGDLKRCIYWISSVRLVRFFSSSSLLSALLLLFSFPRCLISPRGSLDDCDSGWSSTGSSLKRLMISGLGARSKKDERKIYSAYLYACERTHTYLDAIYVFTRARRLNVLTVSTSLSYLFNNYRSKFRIEGIPALR